jgi:hypothetical protein
VIPRSEAVVGSAKRFDIVERADGDGHDCGRQAHFLSLHEDEEPKHILLSTRQHWANMACECVGTLRVASARPRR